MKMFGENRNALADNWHWAVACGGGAALIVAAVCAINSYSVDSATAATDMMREIGSRSARDAGVGAVDAAPFAAARKAVAAPFLVTEPIDSQASFLASGRRVYCAGADKSVKACARPIPFGLKECPFCHAVQPSGVKVVLDGDKDGLPDEYEKKYGLNPKNPADANEDKDGDGFTNMEEFVAKTDPSDQSSHPDYLDFVKIVPPLQNTTLPFIFTGVTKTPSGVKFFFKDPKKRSVYGQPGVTYSVLAGEKIGDSGFVAKIYEEKKIKVKIPGSSLTKAKDVSIATVERVSDGKLVTLKIDDKRFAAVDMKATLVFSRDGGKEFVVAPGDEIELYREKYRVKEINKKNKTIKVVVVSSLDETKERTIEALEQ